MANPNPTHKWRKGESGNPSGRPKGLVPLTKILNNALEDDHIEVKEVDGKKVVVKTNYAVLLIMRMLDLAVVQGNDKLIREIFDRIEGKPVQAINLGGQAGNPVELMQVDPDTQKKIQAMRERWFKEQPKPKRNQLSTTGKPIDNQLTTTPKRKVVIKKKAKAKK